MARKAHRTVPALSAVALCAVAITAGSVSCGLDDYTYLPSVTDSGGYVMLEMNNKATMPLPSPPPDASYSIVYRMYVSELDITGQIQSSYSELSKINSSLASDYNTLWSYADPSNTSTNTAGVGGAFDSRGYFTLALEDGGGAEVDIGDVLGSGEVIIEFPAVTQAVPTLTMTPGGGSATTYKLLRSQGPDSLNSKENTPLPTSSRYFLNYTELNSKQQDNSAIPDNLDVAGKSGTFAFRRTYVMLYIFAVGRDPGTLNNIYSKPMFIGILKLPEA
jgi:hypothetical protein